MLWICALFTFFWVWVNLCGAILQYGAQGRIELSVHNTWISNIFSFSSLLFCAHSIEIAQNKSPFFIDKLCAREKLSNSMALNCSERFDYGRFCWRKKKAERGENLRHFLHLNLDLWPFAYLIYDRIYDSLLSLRNSKWNKNRFLLFIRMCLNFTIWVVTLRIPGNLCIQAWQQRCIIALFTNSTSVTKLRSKLGQRMWVIKQKSRNHPYQQLNDSLQHPKKLFSNKNEMLITSSVLLCHKTTHRNERERFSIPFFMQ